MINNAHFFNIDTLIDIKQYCWVIDKLRPNVPIFKISQSDFNLIKSGVYKSQGNKIEFNGSVYWLPNELSNKLKVKLKLSNSNFTNLGISMQEFLNKDIIDSIKFDVKLDTIKHLKGKSDDIYIICPKQTRKSYETIIEKLIEKLKVEEIIVKSFYFISETFYNQNDDDIRFKKIKILAQHLVGYKTEVNKFIDNEITRYKRCYYYDNQYDTLKIIDEVNPILKSIMNKTDDGLKSVIKEDINEYLPVLFVVKVTDNDINRNISKSVKIEYSNLIKTFEKFILKNKN